MGARFGLKRLPIGALIPVLMVPMLLLRGLVGERQQWTVPPLPPR